MKSRMACQNSRQNRRNDFVKWRSDAQPIVREARSPAALRLPVHGRSTQTLGGTYDSAMTLLLKNLLFTLIVPGTVGVYVPLYLAPGEPAATGAVLLLAVILLAIGGAIYAW